MANTNETFADIIAEMRDWLGDANSYDLRSLANRLEAAHKRECATIEKSSTVGNCAKLREALEMMNALFEQGAICTSSANSAEEMDQIEELYRKTKAALTEPPRNCDKYSHDEALRIWSAEPENPMNGCFDEWLYAPATERKGGRDEDN